MHFIWGRITFEICNWEGLGTKALHSYATTPSNKIVSWSQPTTGMVLYTYMYIGLTEPPPHIYCVLLMGPAWAWVCLRATCKRSWPSPFHSSIMLSIPLVILTMNVLKCRTPRRHEFMPCGRVDHSLIHQGLHRYFKLHMSGGGGARVLRNCEQLLHFHK